MGRQQEVIIVVNSANVFLMRSANIYFWPQSCVLLFCPPTLFFYLNGSTHCTTCARSTFQELREAGYLDQRVCS